MHRKFKFILHANYLKFCVTHTHVNILRNSAGYVSNFYFIELNSCVFFHWFPYANNWIDLIFQWMYLDVLFQTIELMLFNCAEYSQFIKRKIEINCIFMDWKIRVSKNWYLLYAWKAFGKNYNSMILQNQCRHLNIRICSSVALKMWIFCLQHIEWNVAKAKIMCSRN